MQRILYIGLFFSIQLFLFSQTNLNPRIELRRPPIQSVQTAPVADFAASSFNINVGDTIDFYDQSLNSPQIWTWTFSGGSPWTSNVQNPQNIEYNYPGYFDVELTVENSDGTDTKVITNYIVVNQGGTSPVAQFSASSNNPLVYSTVQINDFSYNSPTSWQWTITPNTYGFLSGTNSTSKDIILEFYQPGTYKVRMEANNSYGNDIYEEDFYVTEFPCDTLMWIKVPDYEVNSIDSALFAINNFDNDGNLPVQIIYDSKVGSVSGSCDVGTSCDLYHKIYDSNNNLIHSSTTIDDENPPVWWYYSPILFTTDQTYEYHVWDDDGSWSGDDDMGYVSFPGAYQNGFETYTDGNGLSVTLWQYNHGYDHNWTVRDDIWHYDSNYCYGATSYFTPLASADNWLTFGPITIPNEGAELVWNHHMRSNSYRDGYIVHASLNGGQISDFTQYGIPLRTYQDNDSLTDNHTKWTRQNIELSDQTFGGQQVYFAFQHNANDMFALHLDEIILRGCNSPPVSLMPEPSERLNLFPNPAKSTINVNYRGLDYIEMVRLYDVSGKCLLSTSFENENERSTILDLEPFKSGVYIVEVIAGSHIYRDRVAILD